MPSGFQFVASTNRIVPIYQLIHAISPFGNNCFLSITQDALCFSIVANNVCKVLLTLDRRLFQSYEFSQDENVTINIDLRSLLETINIHIPEKGQNEATGRGQFRGQDNVGASGGASGGSNGGAGDAAGSSANTKCTLSYQQEGAPFVLTFEDDQIVERCELLTYYVDPEAQEAQTVATTAEDSETIPEDSALFQLDTSQIIFEVVLQSSIMYETLKDMNDLTTDEFVLYCSNREQAKHKRRLIFVSRSEDTSVGYSKLIVPDRKPFLKEMSVYKPHRSVETGETDMVACTASVSSFYRFNYFAKIIRAIKLSKLLKVRKDMNGLTSFLMLVGSSSQTGYYGTSIEFVTLESIPIEDRILSEQMTRAELAEGSEIHGYNNIAIERMIHDDDNIGVIRITGDGQLMIDDYFAPMQLEDVPDTSATAKTTAAAVAAAARAPSLHVTDDLTRSVLGLNPHPADLPPVLAAAIDVNGTVEGSARDEPTTPQPAKGRKRTKRAAPKRKGKKAKKYKGSKGSKYGGGGGGDDDDDDDDDDDVATVGGAIEIPLFI